MFNVKKETTWTDEVTQTSYVIKEYSEEKYWADDEDENTSAYLCMTFLIGEDEVLWQASINITECIPVHVLKYAMLFANVNGFSLEKALTILKYDCLSDLIRKKKDIQVINHAELE